MKTDVIVITQDELENKIELGAALNKIYNHTHYAVTRASNIETAIWNVINNINNGATNEQLIIELKGIIGISDDIAKEIHHAQEIIGPIKRRFTAS